MANEDKKDFNAMLYNKKDMPKIVKLDKDAAAKWGGESMVVAAPYEYDEVMKKVVKGKLITTAEIRKYIAKKHNVDITCPLTAGIFINIVAWASHQRDRDITPYWRTLKTAGELNEKYPGGVLEQKKKLEEEGYEILTKGKKNIKYYVNNYENYLMYIKE